MFGRGEDIVIVGMKMIIKSKNSLILIPIISKR